MGLLKCLAKLPAGSRSSSNSGAGDCAAAVAAAALRRHRYVAPASGRCPAAAAVAASSRAAAVAECTRAVVGSSKAQTCLRRAAADTDDAAARGDAATGAAARCMHSSGKLLQHRHTRSTSWISAGATSYCLPSSNPVAATALHSSTAAEAATAVIPTVPAARASLSVAGRRFPPAALFTAASATAAAVYPAGAAAMSTAFGSRLPTTSCFSSEQQAVSAAAAAAGGVGPAGVAVGSRRGGAAAASRLRSATAAPIPSCLRPHTVAVAAAVAAAASPCVGPAAAAAARPSKRLPANVGSVWGPAGVWGAAAAADIQELQRAAGGRRRTASSLSLLVGCLSPLHRGWGSSRLQEAKRSICMHWGAAAASTLQLFLRRVETPAAAPQQQQQRQRCSSGIGAEGWAAAAATARSQQLLPQQQRSMSYARHALGARRAAAATEQQLQQQTRQENFSTKPQAPSETQQGRQETNEKIVLTPKLVLRRSPYAAIRFPTTLKEGAYAVLPAQPIPPHIKRPAYACTAGGVYPAPSRSSSRSSTGDVGGGSGAAAAAAASAGTVQAAGGGQVAAAPPPQADQEEEEEEDAFAPVQPLAAQEKLRRAARVAANALQLCMRAAREGLTTEDLDRIAHEYIVGMGAYPAAVNFHNFPKAICTSVNEVACHGIPDLRPLQKGDILSIDCTSFLDGYFGDCAATVMIGEVLPQHRKLVEASKEALEKAIKMVKPGLPISEIGRYTSEVAHAHGFSVVREFSGHFIGRKLHLPPLISHVYPNSTEGIFRVGQTLTIEPILCEGSADIFSWKDGWSIATQDGGRSAQFEHTLLVTEDGAEILTLPTI